MSDNDRSDCKSLNTFDHGERGFNSHEVGVFTGGCPSEAVRRALSGS